MCRFALRQAGASKWHGALGISFQYLDRSRAHVINPDEKGRHPVNQLKFVQSSHYYGVAVFEATLVGVV